MIFEVDNTTEQLIKRLQESIEGTINALEDGQREIKDLIDEVKQSSTNLATAAQADLMTEDVSKVRAAIQKLATTEQLTEIQSALPKMSDDIEQQIHTIMDAQSASEGQLEKLLTKMFSSESESRIAQLQAIATNLDTLSRHIDTQMVKLSSEADDTMAIVKSNRAVLSSIADYLSLPGYKRFFKGMEVPTNEAAQ